MLRIDLYFFAQKEKYLSLIHIYLALTVTEAFYFTVFFNHTSLFILVQNPKRNADVRGVAEVSGKDNDCLDEIVLYKLSADF